MILRQGNWIKKAPPTGWMRTSRSITGTDGGNQGISPSMASTSPITNGTWPTDIQIPEEFTALIISELKTSAWELLSHKK
jgi:hypothetical protein